MSYTYPTTIYQQPQVTILYDQRPPLPTRPPLPGISSQPQPPEEIVPPAPPYQPPPPPPPPQEDTKTGEDVAYSPTQAYDDENDDVVSSTGIASNKEHPVESNPFSSSVVTVGGVLGIKRKEQPLPRGNNQEHVQIAKVKKVALSSIFNLGNDDDDDDDNAKISNKTAKNGPSIGSSNSGDRSNASGMNNINQESNSNNNNNDQVASDKAPKRRNKWGPPPSADSMALSLGLPLGGPGLGPDSEGFPYPYGISGKNDMGGSTTTEEGVTTSKPMLVLDRETATRIVKRNIPSSSSSSSTSTVSGGSHGDVGSNSGSSNDDANALSSLFDSVVDRQRLNQQMQEQKVTPLGLFLYMYLVPHI